VRIVGSSSVGAVTGFVVRRMTAADVPEMVEMYSQSWLDTYVSPDHGVPREWVEQRVALRSTPQNLERLASVITGQDPASGANYVAVANGRIIGMCRPYRDAQGGYHVGAIYVDKAWHGTPVGSALMEKILAFVGPARSIELQVATYNQRARAFYRKWGFVEEPGTETLYDGVITETTMIRPPASRTPL
jgi:ribosomal protein S18 acetylase RimI-like enzyme